VTTTVGSSIHPSIHSLSNDVLRVFCESGAIVGVIDPKSNKPAKFLPYFLVRGEMYIGEFSWLGLVMLAYNLSYLGSKDWESAVQGKSRAKN
jgi:hypothetical protein